MTNARMRMHELNEAVDLALKAATEALGTPQFPLLLVRYERAVELASAWRASMRVGSPVGTRELSDA